MKRIFKKLLSILLAFTLLFGSFAFGFSDVDWSEFAVKASAEETETYSGTCGDNLTWSLNIETGELVISGTGDMYDWSYYDVPWYNHHSSIKSVTIGNSVTSIGDGAFMCCYSLTNITISDSVTSIGEDAFCGTEYYNDSNNWNNNVLYIGKYLINTNDVISGSYEIKDGTLAIANSAFYYCTNLTSVTIPDSVTNIGDSAFYYCTNLTSVTIPDSVTNIGDSAFYYCTNLTSVTIPDSVTSIGDGAFCYCTSLKSITVDPANTAYSSDEYGVLFNKDKTLLIQYPAGNIRTSYVIPDSVTNIGGCAFYRCYILESVTIGNSVTSIGDAAFMCCYSLTNITISDSVTSIGEFAFYGCESLTSVTIPDSVTSIGMGMFSYCSGLTNVTIGNSVTSISGGMFEFCTSLTNVTIGNSVISIGDYAFVCCIILTSVTIPDSVTSIGDYAFSSCYATEYIHIPSTVTSIGKSIIVSDSEKAELIDEIKATLEDASEEELEEYAKRGITKDSVANWKPTTVICSDSEDSLAKTYAKENGHAFEVCDGSHRIEVPDEPTTEPTTHPEETTTVPTTAPVVTEPTTTKPAVTEPTTTEPSTTKPVETTTTTKPVETTKLATTKPIETTKPEPVEEEIIKKPSTNEVKYGETLILHADFENIPDGAKIEWSVEGSGVTIAPSADGKTCAVTSTATGDVTITAKYVDANGVEHISEQEIESNASFWNKIVSFFKNLFGINRIIEQVFKF